MHGKLEQMASSLLNSLFWKKHRALGGAGWRQVVCRRKVSWVFKYRPRDQARIQQWPLGHLVVPPTRLSLAEEK